MRILEAVREHGNRTAGRPRVLVRNGLPMLPPSGDAGSRVSWDDALAFSKRVDSHVGLVDGKRANVRFRQRATHKEFSMEHDAAMSHACTSRMERDAGCGRRV